MSRKPVNIWTAVRANFYSRFCPSKLTSLGTQRVEVMRLPDGSLFTLPVSNVLATTPQSMPLPPPYLVVYQDPLYQGVVGGANASDIFQSNDIGGDNMPEECSPEPWVQPDRFGEGSDFTDKIHEEAKAMEDHLNCTKNKE